MPLRRNLLDSFEPALLPVACLDRYSLMGSIAGWWDEIRYELRVIVENGFPELVDGWVETLRSALEDDDADDDEDSDIKKTVKVSLEELLAHPFKRTAPYGGEEGMVSRADKRSHGGRLASPEIRHLNQEQLARRLGVSQRTLEGWRYRGKGPAYLRLGGRIAYRVIDVERFETECLRTGARVGSGEP